MLCKASAATRKDRSANLSRCAEGSATCAAHSLPTANCFAALSHSEFDPLSSEESAERFTQLGASVDAALAAARDAKDAVIGSFDVLIVRTEHRTNEIMKILTLASILLLPGALIAGVMGMNVNFKAGVFANSPLFWAVITAIALLATATLAAARSRRWI